MSHAWKITAAMGGAVLLGALVAPRLSTTPMTSELPWLTSSEQAALYGAMDDEAWGDLGDQRMAQGDRAGAIEAYRRAFELDPTDSEWTDNLAGLLGHEEQVRLLERVLEARPGDDEIMGNLADLYRARGEHDRAIELYIRAMRTDPGDSEWHTALTELGRGDLVVGVVDAMPLGEGDEEIGDRADLLYSAGRVDEACDLYRRALALDPSDDEWQRALAFKCAEGGYADVALLAEAGGEGTLDAALALYRTGQVDRARQIATAGVRANPEEQALRFFAAHLEGRSQESLLVELSESYPGNDEILGDLGDLYMSQGRISEARTAYQRAYALDPGDGEWEDKVALSAALSR